MLILLGLSIEKYLKIFAWQNIIGKADKLFLVKKII
jgi:hypothetical protein